MHMADALLSPAVGGSLWAVTAGTIAWSSSKVRNELDDRKVPLMGVLGAFLFAAQMINFTIPATGSSGHLSGGMLLAVLLGPHAAFLTIASVLVVQALFFADGGLLALGCNIFNMGFFPAFVVYPLVYKGLLGANPSQGRRTLAIVISSIIGLQLGPFGVVLETVASGISSLPFSTFVMLMQPIHLAIGLVEGVVTAAVVSFVYRARPEILQSALEVGPIASRSIRGVVCGLLAAALLTGGVLSWFASENPDGLEWAIKKATGKEELEGPKAGLHGALSAVQEKTAVLPDYTFRKPAKVGQQEAAKADGASHPPQPAAEGKKGSRLGTSFSGVVGGFLTLVLAVLIGFALRRRPSNHP